MFPVVQVLRAFTTENTKDHGEIPQRNSLAALLHSLRDKKCSLVTVDLSKSPKQVKREFLQFPNKDDFSVFGPE